MDDMTLIIIQEGVKGVAIFSCVGIFYCCLSILFGGQVKKRRHKNGLKDEERKAIAECIKEGGHVKQVAANWKVSPAYVYMCVSEFLEWKLEWRMKNE